MNLSPLRYFAALLAVLAGCLGQHDCYQLEIKPEGERFRRTLTCWRVSGNTVISSLSADRRAAIAALYPKNETAKGGKKNIFKSTFTGHFTGSTPADVGGAGSLVRFASPLGDAWSYVERFRGNDATASELAKRREAADKLTDLLVGWATAEVGQDPRFPALKTFLDRDLRRDLRNLVVYAWTYQAVDNTETAEVESVLRGGQYLCERGYFSPQDVPALSRALLADDPKPLLAQVQRFLARKMGVADAQPIPASLGFLGDLQRLCASFEKYGRSAGLSGTQREAPKPRPQGRAGSKPPPMPESNEMPAAVAAFELLIEAMGIQFVIFSGDVLDLELVSGEKPYATNGKWDDKNAAVTWSKDIDTAEGLPVVCFALWSAPERSFQQAHFGRVLVSGDKLAEYAIWYNALKPQEAAEWDRLIGRLKPGPGLEAAVKSLRFAAARKADVKKPDEQGPDLSEAPRSMILEGLQAKPDGAK